MTRQTIILENRSYWTKRSTTYSEEHREALADEHREIWKKLLIDEITRQFPERSRETLRILDVGTGPGFFAIILAGVGCRVTAVDLTPAMLEEARHNAGNLTDVIDFREMNAEALTFPDGCFDVIVTRNLTWNLPHTEKAYGEWYRVLKKGGMLLNFDANWYNYLFDNNARAGYDLDRENTAAQGYKDLNVNENYDVMEDIARRIPISAIVRPEWDRQILEELGMEVTVDTRIWQKVWSGREQLNFGSTPMFMIRAIRK